MGNPTMGIKFMIGTLVVFTCLALLPRTVSASATAQATPHADTSASASLYLPLVNTVTREPQPEGEVVTRFWLPFQTADNKVVTLYGPTVAVDSQGGIHIAYTIRAGQDDGHRPAYYLYCPANCNEPEQWSRTHISDNIADARLALDAAGKPRIMLFSDFLNLEAGINHFYQYAACNRLPCSEASNWQIGTIQEVNDFAATRMDNFHRYFALNPQGQPGFVYHDNSSGHSGTFYRYCTSAPQQCANPENWAEWKMNSGYLPAPQLAYTRQGEPRFLTSDISDSTTTKLLYVECDAACATRATWAYLTVLGPFATYDFAITRSGEPRILLYTGHPTTNQTLATNQLHYIWCHADCTITDAANGGMNWYGYPMQTHAFFGMTISLVLDAEDRPHLAYQMGDEAGPGYTWCTGNCESNAGAAGWQKAILADTSAELNQDWPVIPWYNCSISTWTSGRRPWLALDPRNDAPRISYEAAHMYGGTDLDHPGIACPVKGDIFLARVALLTP